MKYHNIKEGIFVSRPNRFVAYVEIAGNVEICHVKNTGRCKELLVPGAKVLVEESNNPNRKTKYDLVQVYKGEKLINMDSQMPNYLVREWVEQKYHSEKNICMPQNYFPNVTKIQAEKTYGDSRFDLYLEYAEKKAWIEIKGVTLEDDGICRFPDAPTQRGVKHIRELENSLQDGYEAWIIFVIQMNGMRQFQPNWKTHEEFGEALVHAEQAGVHVLALECNVSEGEIYIEKEIEINLKKEQMNVK